MSKYAWMCNHACHLRKREEKGVFECVLFVHICLCVHACVCVFDKCKYQAMSLHFLLRCRLLCSHAEWLLHNNEK